jgi:hypothetical protein
MSPPVVRLLCVDFDPPALARASLNRLADDHLIVSVGEGWVATLFWATQQHRRIHRVVQSPESVGETLDVTAGQELCSSARGIHERGITVQNLVGPFPMAQPELVGLLG